MSKLNISSGQRAALSAFSEGLRPVMGRSRAMGSISSCSDGSCAGSCAQGCNGPSCYATLSITPSPQP